MDHLSTTYLGLGSGENGSGSCVQEYSIWGSYAEENTYSEHIRGNDIPIRLADLRPAPRFHKDNYMSLAVDHDPVQYLMYPETHAYAPYRETYHTSKASDLVYKVAAYQQYLDNLDPYGGIFGNNGKDYQQYNLDQFLEQFNRRGGIYNDSWPAAPVTIQEALESMLTLCDPIWVPLQPDSFAENQRPLLHNAIMAHMNHLSSQSFLKYMAHQAGSASKDPLENAARLRNYHLLGKYLFILKPV